MNPCLSSSRWGLWVVVLVAMMRPADVLADAAPAHPEPKQATDVEWHRQIQFHRDQLSLRRADLLMIGDSLTEFWQHHGAKAWQDRLRTHRSVNAGIAADRVENILYRVQRLGLSKARPRVAVVLAGTNNLAADPPDSPESVAHGCMAIVNEIRAASPTTRIVLVSIPPNGRSGTDLQSRIAATNELLSAAVRLAEVEWLDLHAQLLDPHGAWKPGLSLDGTHFSADGYGVFADVLHPVIARLLADSADLSR